MAGLAKRIMVGGANENEGIRGLSRELIPFQVCRRVET
jgi:hypothetical protein